MQNKKKRKINNKNFKITNVQLLKIYRVTFDT